MQMLSMTTYAAAPPAPPKKKKAAACPPSPPAAKSILERVELGAKSGWSAGQVYGANAGTVAGVAAFGHLGYAVGAAVCPGATLLGLAVGIAVGVIEERHVARVSSWAASARVSAAPSTAGWRAPSDARSDHAGPLPGRRWPSRVGPPATLSGVPPWLSCR